MCQAGSAASAAGIPAAVTNNGRTGGSAHGRHRVGGRVEPGPGHAGHRDAGLGVWLGLLAHALTGMPAIWPAVGGVSPARSPSRAPQAGSGASARSSGARSIAGSPHAAGVMLMPDSRQPDDGAGKYPEMPMCGNSMTRRVIRNSPAQAFADLHLIVSKLLIPARRA
jgi:hypothetical protein